MNISVPSIIGRASWGALYAVVLVGLAATTTARAQDTGATANDEPVEEIVVHGIRSSIRDAISRKRNAGQIIDCLLYTSDAADDYLTV